MSLFPSAAKALPSTYSSALNAENQFKETKNKNPAAAKQMRGDEPIYLCQYFRGQ
jgi:hypothetical protein